MHIIFCLGLTWRSSVIRSNGFDDSFNHRNPPYVLCLIYTLYKFLVSVGNNNIDINENIHFEIMHFCCHESWIHTEQVGNIFMGILQLEAYSCAFSYVDFKFMCICALL